jgi:redox-regulated HSP33 family molecular chaperone
VSNLSKEEIQERYGEVPNVEMECSECMKKYATPVADACPEWDKECKMKQS